MKATTWNSDIKSWKLPRYDRTNFNIINDGTASNSIDNEIACIKGKEMWMIYRAEFRFNNI